MGCILVYEKLIILDNLYMNYQQKNEYLTIYLFYYLSIYLL